MFKPWRTWSHACCLRLGISSTYPATLPTAVIKKLCVSRGSNSLRRGQSDNVRTFDAQYCFVVNPIPHKSKTGWGSLIRSMFSQGSQASSSIRRLDQRAAALRERKGEERGGIVEWPDLQVQLFPCQQCSSQVANHFWWTSSSMVHHHRNDWDFQIPSEKSPRPQQVGGVRCLC